MITLALTIITATTARETITDTAMIIMYSTTCGRITIGMKPPVVIRFLRCYGRTTHLLSEKIRADFAHAANADDGEVHESEFEFELFWAMNNRIAWFVEFPVILLDPRSDPSTAGIGDLEAGFRFVAFDGEYDIVTFGLNVATPTGDADRHLGAGHTHLEPAFLWWHDFRLRLGTAKRNCLGDPD